MTDRLRSLLGDTQARLLGLLRRAPLPITALAEALGVTDNAVRLHVAELRREGLVVDVGADRDTGGKPARLYGLTKAGEELFPKAYALVLGELVAEIVRTQGRTKALALLRGVGNRLAKGSDPPGGTSLDSRVSAAASALRELGADLEVQRLPGGVWRLQGHGCPLTAVTGEHPEVCALARTVVSTIAGERVRECCDRSSERPRCAFELPAAS